MERVLYNLHSNVCSIGLRRTNSKTRSLAEHSLLLIALCGFGVLIISHISFVHRPTPTASFIEKRKTSIPTQCLSSIDGFDEDAHITHVLLWNEEDSKAFSLEKDSDSFFSLHGMPQSNDDPNAPPKEARICRDETANDSLSLMSLMCHSVPPPERIILSYSPVRGFLFLPLETATAHNVTTQYVFISKTNVKCFGEPFLQFLVHHLLGVETVAFHWLLAHATDQSGYIYNPKTRQLTDFNTSGNYSLWKATGSSRTGRHALLFKAGVILTSVFLFFITTTLVSFTLRETQDRMLHFAFQLQMHVEQERRLGSLITTHVVENLVFVPIMVGVMFFLIEFYGGDKLLAFMVMTIVWVCEVFSIIAIRSTQGMQFFPKIFFLLFTLFHVYFFSCPFGFSYMALTSTSIFMIHSMYFFWHRYELPAVALGLVNIDNPRMRATPARGPSDVDHIMVPMLQQDANRGSSDQHPPQRLHLPPRNPILRGQSHPSMSSLGRNSMASRPPSSTSGMPFHGDDDEDGSESYMYFMNGEVVMHRERTARGRSPSISTHGSSDHHETSSVNGPPSEAASSDNNVPQRIVASPAAIVQTASNTSEITAPEAMISPSPTRHQRRPRSNSPIRRSQDAATQVDADLTPRIGSSSSSHEIDPTANGPAPFFPMGVFRRTNSKR